LPESPPWWKVFDAEKDEIDEVCKVLANLYRQPKAKYVEVAKDSKSFVLTSRAWEPSLSVKVFFLPQRIQRSPKNLLLHASLSLVIAGFFVRYCSC
jgi:hypothetical protein